MQETLRQKLIEAHKLGKITKSQANDIFELFIEECEETSESHAYELAIQEIEDFSKENS